VKCRRGGANGGNPKSRAPSKDEKKKKRKGAKENWSKSGEKKTFSPPTGTPVEGERDREVRKTA